MTSETLALGSGRGAGVVRVVTSKTRNTVWTIRD